LRDYNKDFNITKNIEKGNGVYVVSITTKDKMEKLVNVDFRVVDKNGKLLITDVIPEGISFIGGQRTEIKSEIDKKGFKTFMADLTNKTK
jgi:ABC-type transporter MlaC component